LRREGYPKPYEAMLDLTRTNDKVTREAILTFIDALNVDENIKAELRAITPFNFTGF
jgi:adenylosuccinate lyase